MRRPAGRLFSFASAARGTEGGPFGYPHRRAPRPTSRVDAKVLPHRGDEPEDPAQPAVLALRKSHAGHRRLADPGDRLPPRGLRTRLRGNVRHARTQCRCLTPDAAGSRARVFRTCPPRPLRVASRSPGGSPRRRRDRDQLLRPRPRDRGRPGAVEPRTSRPRDRPSPGHDRGGRRHRSHQQLRRHGQPAAPAPPGRPGRRTQRDRRRTRPERGRRLRPAGSRRRLHGADRRDPRTGRRTLRRGRLRRLPGAGGEPRGGRRGPALDRDHVVAGGSVGRDRRRGGRRPCRSRAP